MFFAEMSATGTIAVFIHGDVLRGQFYVDEEATTTTARRE
jgi:hypothetical protein